MPHPRLTFPSAFAMPTSAPFLQPLQQALGYQDALLLGVPLSAAAHVASVSAALLSLSGHLWQLRTPSTLIAQPMDEAPMSCALVLQPSEHLSSTLAQQALACDVQALAQHFGLQLWRLHADTAQTPSEAAWTQWPAMNLAQLGAWLQTHHLTELSPASPSNTLLGRFGRHVSAKNTWQQVRHLKPQHVAFIHGFGGSTQGQKARFLEVFCRQHKLPFMALSRQGDEHPDQALQGFRDQLKVWRHQPVLLVGSSLGGFLARQLAHELSWPCLLINPSVMPQTTLLGRLPDEACKRYNAFPMRSTPGMRVMLTDDDELLDHSITQIVLTGADFIWHEQQGHRWRDNQLIGDAVLHINAHRQQSIQLAH